MNKKIVWTEGTLLSQQHFQQQEKMNFDEHYLDRQLRESWGVVDCLIDRESLNNGIYKVLKLKLLLDDYRWVEYDSEYDDSPLSYELSDEIENLYLICPRGRQTSCISGYPELKMNECAYVGKYEVIKDDSDSNRESEVLFGELNISLSNVYDKSHDCSVIKLNELRRFRGRVYHVSDGYIPPLLLMNNFNNGLRFVKNILNMIEDRQREFKRHSGASVQDEQVIMKIIVSRYLFHLNCIIFEKKTGPKKVYLLLHQLLSELVVCFDDKHRKVFVSYDHYDLYNTFKTITEEIQILLLKNMNGNTVLQFTRKNDRSYVIEELPDDLLTLSDIYLLISGLSRVERVSLSLKKDMKMSAISDMRMLTQCALSGIKMTIVSSPVENVSSHLDDVIFRVEKDDSLWRKVMKEKNIAIQCNLDNKALSISLVLCKQ